MDTVLQQQSFFESRFPDDGVVGTFFIADFLLSIFEM
jgi:hypothetical protein